MRATRDWPVPRQARRIGGFAADAVIDGGEFTDHRIGSDTDHRVGGEAANPTIEPVSR